MYRSSFFYREVNSSHSLRVHPWIHHNFSEDGYRYFTSLGLTSEDAIHLASTKINALFFRKKSEQASADFTDQREIRDAQLNYLLSQIKTLIQSGGWSDDLQHSINSIAEAINSGQPWGGEVDAKEIGEGERFVYMTAIEHAKELKRIANPQMVDQVTDDASAHSSNSHGELPILADITCVIS